jgi:hypothetical protein
MQYSPWMMSASIANLNLQADPKNRNQIIYSYPAKFPNDRVASSFQQPKTLTTFPDWSNRAKHMLSAVGFLVSGLMLHRLPAYPSSFALISSDWKDWTRMVMGVLAVGEINKSLDWQAKPWQLALETVAILSPLSNGFLNRKGWRQFPLLAVFVPTVVQATDWINQWAERQLKEKKAKVPLWLPKLAISLSSTLAGLFAIRSVIKTNTYRQWVGQEGSSSTNPVVGAEAIICTRCGGQHLLCMSELSDMAGSMGAWLKGQSQKKES